MAAPFSKQFLPLAMLLLVTVIASTLVNVAIATWCVAKSAANEETLQTALDYACASGADCTPILSSSGDCYLPNTLLAHASYAFNSYYQRKAMAPASCVFSGTSTIAKTDPSFGSCVYPSSISTAGGAITPGGTTIPDATPSVTAPPPTTPSVGAPPPPMGTKPPLNTSGELAPGIGVGPQVPNSQNSITRMELSIIRTLFPVAILIIFSNTF